MSLKDKIEVLEICNDLQNEYNSFVNFNNDDLELVYNLSIKKSLERDEIKQILIELGYV